MNRAGKQQGLGFIKVIALTPLILIGVVILTLIFSLLYKGYWDYRVERLCEKDGGRTVYEVIKVSEDELNKLRNNGKFISLPTRSRAKTGDRFIYNAESTKLHRGILGLKVSRYVFQAIRLKDEKVIAEQISYGRSHDDFYPLPAVHHSSFGCPRYKDNFFLRKIFIKVG